MSRIKRIMSESGIYHVMVRGNAGDNIFIDSQDKEKYIKILKEKKEDANFRLYAYCIMTNHFHIIIKEEDEPLSNIMKRINISYALYFNKKYDRVGHVFQGRYRSEPIEDDRYLLTAVRYIHNNPVKAKLVTICDEYSWSSYNEYIRRTDESLIDSGFVLSLFSSDKNRSVKLFKNFSLTPNEDKLIDIDSIRDEPEIKGYYAAEKYIEEYLGTQKIKLEDLKKRKLKQKRDELILNLRKNSNLSIRDIAKLLHIGRNMVSNAK